MKPTLFNTDMVRGLLDGRKTVTRRVVKPQPVESPALKMCPDDVWRLEWWNINEFHSIKVPICIGDILYVRETWCVQSARRFDADARIEFKAGGDMARIQFPGGGDQYHSRREYDTFVARWADDRWHPSIHMPREAARIFLRVTDVRVERLQDITEEQAQAEGVKGWMVATDRDWDKNPNHLIAFRHLWDSTIKKADRARYGWDASPWVWVIEFKRCEKPEGE